jgi:predicted nucleotide-binding protein
MTPNELSQAVRDVIAELEKRAKAADNAAMQYGPNDTGFTRCMGKAAAYEHAAELVRMELGGLVKP